MNQILTPFERLAMRALLELLIKTPGHDSITLKLSREIDDAIRTSDGQQRADEAQKRIVP